ncbi:hypothetical protein PCI56_10170 [Plesiomonas shigelloides subsp. oncorhynchi]|nr:hypothetical protein [Plesiomonas shigelloides]
MHRQLWDKQLEQLRWLTADGLVQQTRFSDGSLITANFSQQAQQVAATPCRHSVYWRSWLPVSKFAGSRRR